MAFSLLGLALSQGMEIEAGIIAPIASAGIILSGCGLTLSAFQPSKGLWIAFLGTIAIGATFELISLKTGFPFGHYTYTETWKPTITLPGGTEFPILMPIAWSMFVGAAAAALRDQKPIFGKLLPIGVALLATGIDLPLEVIVANHLDYWTWDKPAWPIGADPAGIPILNYIGWIVTSALAAPLWLRLEKSDKSNFAGWNILIPYALFLLGMAIVFKIFS